MTDGGLCQGKWFPARYDTSVIHRGRKLLAKNPSTAPQKGIKRGVAILYGAQKIVFVDYTQKNLVTGRYLLHMCAIDNFFTQ